MAEERNTTSASAMSRERRDSQSSDTAATSGGEVRLRADARQNRDQLIQAARELVLEEGSNTPLEGIARRAGVGVGTLYRRFPDREALLRAVALDTLAQVTQEAELALTEEAEPFAALARYMQRVVALRVGAVMPALVGALPPHETAIFDARDAAVMPVQALIDAAQAAGTLRADVDFSDIGLLTARLSQPLPGPFPRAVADALAQRHLTILLDGLRSTPGTAATPLPGPALSLREIQGENIAPTPERD